MQTLFIIVYLLITSLLSFLPFPALSNVTKEIKDPFFKTHIAHKPEGTPATSYPSCISADNNIIAGNIPMQQLKLVGVITHNTQRTMAIFLDSQSKMVFTINQGDLISQQFFQLHEIKGNQLIFIHWQDTHYCHQPVFKMLSL